jgi:hypothetical protein
VVSKQSKQSKQIKSINRAVDKCCCQCQSLEKRKKRKTKEKQKKQAIFIFDRWLCNPAINQSSVATQRNATQRNVRSDQIPLPVLFFPSVLSQKEIMNRSTSSEGGGGAASRLSVIPDWFCLSGSQRSTSYGTGDNNNNTIMDMMLDDSFSALSKKQDTTSTSFDRCQVLGGGGGGGGGNSSALTNNTRASDDHDDATQLQIQEEMANLSVQEQESARNSVLGKSSMTMTSSSSITENKNKITNTGYGGEETVSSTTTTTTTIHHQNKEEDPELLQERLYELDQELDTLDIAAAINMPTTKSAYRLAIEQNPIYINDKKFKTAFLRSERYNAKNSALRIFRFLEEKLDLFGTNKLCQDILLDDIGDDGLRILQIGGHHILPKRDKANRKVVFGISAVEQIGYTIFGAVRT